MSVMERSVTETTLPIYHRSIDWDALYRRYPVPDVFERTRWRWSADEDAATTSSGPACQIDDEVTMIFGNLLRGSSVIQFPYRYNATEAPD